MFRVVLVSMLVVVAAARDAHARDDAADARALLETIEHAKTKEERVGAAAKLAEIGARVIPALQEFLERKHEVLSEQRRVVLGKIGASLPNRNGGFDPPKREKEADQQASDNRDWLAELAELEPVKGLGEVIADVAAIRALAASMKPEAAAIIFDVGFADATMIYRDECGRVLRRMSPYSLPALIRMSALRRDKDRFKKRYADYQLERLDRQDPEKALRAADQDEDLKIAIIEAYGQTEYREAVQSVWKRVDDDAPRIRAAARAAWTLYVTEPHPPPPPRKKLNLAGGVQTEHSKALYLNSLQLARVELDDALQALFAEPLFEKDATAEEIEKKDLAAVSERIYAVYDGERAKKDAALFAEGKGKADRGDLVGAIGIYDRLLAMDPQRAERAQMAPVYYAQAQKLAAEKQWKAAAGLYSKANGLDPKGPQSTEALAAHYYAMGMALEADGKDGGASFRKAIELVPDYAEAKQAEIEAASDDAPAGPPRWPLYAAGAVALAALAMLAIGVMARRRAAAAGAAPSP